MLTLGLNKGQTLRGKTLRYGGATIVKDGKIVLAVLEERVTGVKWASGFDHSLQETLRTGGSIIGSDRPLALKDFDSIGISTCCEGEAAALEGHSLSGEANLISVNHHLSHATYAFRTSPFESAIIIVIDGGGNTLSANQRPEKWWEEPREQHSYYVGTPEGLELVGRDFDEPFAIGFGELYRALAFFLGLSSSRFAQKVMAIAG